MFFLVSTAIIACAGQIVMFASSQAQVRNQIVVEETKSRLEDAHAQLQQLDKIKSQFFANVTHELRTPLTMILAPLENMLAGDFGPLQPTQRAYLEANWRNGIRLLKLINDLLDLAKIEEGFLRLRTEQTDFVPLLNEVIEYARPLAARKNLSLDLDVQNAAPDLHLDLEKLERVLVNLISNALKFTETGGVKVVLDCDDVEARVAIEDTGIGIPHDRIGAVFERFNQGDATVTRRYGGTGIGLAFAREIVEMHGGRISVTSTPGQGSRFVIHLRRGADHIPAGIRDRRQSGTGGHELKRTEDQEPREWAIRLQRQDAYRFCEIGLVTERRLVPRGSSPEKPTRVLVVEDNFEILSLIQLQLRDHYAVYVAQNGKIGLDLARRDLPDVIVSDFTMPEMDGLSMLRALRADPKTAEIPFILLTARNQLADRLSARESGADIYLSKPFSPRELEASVRQLLEKKGRQVGHLIRAHVEGLEAISAGLAHEIHNPLNYIKNSHALIVENVAKLRELTAERTADTADTERSASVKRAQEKIARVVGTASRGIERIENVVALVRRYAREGYPSEPSDVRLDDTIRDVVALIAPRGDQECALTLDLGAADTIVRCIPEELSQSIRALVQNGLDSVGVSSGKVLVRTRPEGGKVLFEVRDDGPGIAPANLNKIFTPFFTTKQGSGMGLGLAIVHRVIHAAGGTVKVSSVPHQETVFCVELPVVAPEGVTIAGASVGAGDGARR